MEISDQNDHGSRRDNFSSFWASWHRAFKCHGGDLKQGFSLACIALIACHFANIGFYVWRFIHTSQVRPAVTVLISVSCVGSCLASVIGYFRVNGKGDENLGRWAKAYPLIAIPQVATAIAFSALAREPVGWALVWNMWALSLVFVELYLSSVAWDISRSKARTLRRKGPGSLSLPGALEDETPSSQSSFPSDFGIWKSKAPAAGEERDVEMGELSQVSVVTDSAHQAPPAPHEYRPDAENPFCA